MESHLFTVVAYKMSNSVKNGCPDCRKTKKLCFVPKEGGRSFLRKISDFCMRSRKLKQFAPFV